MAKSGIKFTFLSGGPESITTINCLSSSPLLKGTIVLTSYTNLTAFQGGNNGLENVVGLKNLSALEIFSVLGDNTLNINLSSLPVNLSVLDIRGQNEIVGNIEDLPNNLGLYNVFGSNKTTGDIKDLPGFLITYRNLGNNTSFGNIKDLPSGLLFYDNEGLNTTTGSLSTLPTNIRYFKNLGNNTIDSYYDGTGGNGYGKRVWASNMRYIEVIPTLLLGQPRIPVSHLVTLLVDLTSTTWSGERTIKLDGPNNPVINLTTYPDAGTAIATLTGAPLNVNVQVNLTT
jgi:hypothetical protein